LRRSRKRIFVRLGPGRELDAAITDSIVRRLRIDCSLRHVPDEIHQVPDIPYTLSARR
jgi:acetoacetyl-CoA synthetase